MTGLARAIDYDATSVRSVAMRRSVENALDGLALHRSAGFWDARTGGGLRLPTRQTVVIGDLHELAAAGGLDRLAAVSPGVSFIFLVRTEADRRQMREPSVALRLNDDKFFVLDLAEERTGGRLTDSRLSEYFSAFVEQLEPDRVRSARFSTVDDILWVEFGDGLERARRGGPCRSPSDSTSPRVRLRRRVMGRPSCCWTRKGGSWTSTPGALRAVFDRTHRQAVEASDQRESEEIGSRLREVRKTTGLTQAQLASSSGIPQETLSRIETGRRHPRIETLRKLASGLGWEMSELLGRIATG